MDETDRERAERWCKLANDRVGVIHALQEQRDESYNSLLTERAATDTLKSQRDGLLDLIALAMGRGQ